MTDRSQIPTAVRRYLQSMETTLKQCIGVSPEDALCSMRDRLLADESLRHAIASAPDGGYSAVVARYGEPEQAAREFAENVAESLRDSAASCGATGAQRLSASSSAADMAPGWRICCTGCGRSAPLAAVGGIRLGARSRHKYTLGFCRGCRRFRFLRIIQDLDRHNLTDSVSAAGTPEQIRATMHRPWATIAIILMMTGGIIVVVWWWLGLLPPRD